MSFTANGVLRHSTLRMNGGVPRGIGNAPRWPATISQPIPAPRAREPQKASSAPVTPPPDQTTNATPARKAVSCTTVTTASRRIRSQAQNAANWTRATPSNAMPMLASDTATAVSGAAPMTRDPTVNSRVKHAPAPRAIRVPASTHVRPSSGFLATSRASRLGSPK